MKVVWVKMQDPTVFDKANIRAITNEKVWGTVKIKLGALDIFPNGKAPACNFFRTTTNKLFGINSVSCYCCDRKSRAACVQSFALWQQATIAIT